MASPMLGNRRSAFEIVSEILTLCSTRRATKTAIMYGSNLSYDQLLRYLSFLCTKNLLEKRDDGCFHITDHGLETLGQLDEVMDSLNGLATSGSSGVKTNGVATAGVG
jgi:predicted transcriptional regulator